jgi:hypothetical protein
MRDPADDFNPIEARCVAIEMLRSDTKRLGVGELHEMQFASSLILRAKQKSTLLAIKDAYIDHAFQMQYPGAL